MDKTVMNKTVMNKGIDKELFTKIAELNNLCPYHNLLAITLSELGLGEAVLTMKISPDLMNPQNIAHGGAAFSLLDTAMGMAIRTKGHFGVTVDISIQYFAPAKLGDTLIATGKVLKLGEKIIVVDGNIVNQDNIAIAVARGTFYNRGKF